jgi:uncharacterized membrane protein YdjX (TVP38/TMEM64 family)
MVEFLRRLGRFVTEMDAKAMTSLGVSVVLLAFVIIMFAFGQEWLRLDREGALAQIFERAAHSQWAIFGVISVYSLLALTGFPQILLFTATIVAFGPQTGALYSWVGTMASATLSFLLGHLFGGAWVRRFGGARVQSSIDFLARHGVLACALIRVVPSAPFIVVNAAAGAAHIPLWKYWLGTGIGIIPKIALVAVIGSYAADAKALEHGVEGLVAFFQSREPRDLAIMALIIPVWLGFLLSMRIVYLRMRRRAQK